MALLDELHYPWHEPLARQLHRTLVDLYPSNQAAVLLAGEAGVDTSSIFQQQPVMFLWKEIVDAAAQGNFLPELVRRALDRLSPVHPSRPFLEELLAGENPAVSAEPRSVDGAPSFLHDDDTVSEPEAKLFGDDLTLPVGQVPGLITALGNALAVAPSVCKLTVGFSPGEQFGTAFRIAPDLLLTNWHVVHRLGDGAPAVKVSAEFGFDDDAQGVPLAPKVVRCNAVPMASDHADDWAVVRATDPLTVAWPAVSLANVAVPAVNGPAYIVQHPMGQRKRIGFVRNQISYVDDRVVHYLTDTDVGSSGSPVLDAAGRLIALHHRGGRPQETVGGAPVRKNEGIRMSRIAAALADGGFADRGVPLDGARG
jgi:Trypsin-like peptidase domain